MHNMAEQGRRDRVRNIARAACSVGLSLAMAFGPATEALAAHYDTNGAIVGDPTTTTRTVTGATTTLLTFSKAGSATDAAPKFRVYENVGGTTSVLKDVTLAWNATTGRWEAQIAGLPQTGAAGNAITYSAKEVVTTTSAPTVTLTLTKAGAEGDPAPVYHVSKTAAGTTEKQDDATLAWDETAKCWKATLTGLAQADDAGNAYVYSATEDVVVPGENSTITVTLTKAGSETDAAPVYHLNQTVSGTTSRLRDVTLAWDSEEKCWKATLAELSLNNTAGEVITYSATEDHETTSTSNGYWGTAEVIWATENNKEEESVLENMLDNPTLYKLAHHNPFRRYVMTDGTIFYLRSDANDYSLDHSGMDYDIQDGYDVRTWVAGTTTTTTTEEPVGEGCITSETVQKTKIVRQEVAEGDVVAESVPGVTTTKEVDPAEGEFAATDTKAADTTVVDYTPETGVVTFVPEGAKTPVTCLLVAVEGTKTGESRAVTSTWADLAKGVTLSGVPTGRTSGEKETWLDAEGVAEGSMQRLWGANALDTMEEVVKDGWSTKDGAANGTASWDTGGTVILSTDSGYWDALTASSVAGVSGAPVLVTNGKTLSAQTSELLGNLKPSKIIVCGGTAAVSDDVISAAKDLSASGVTVQRLSGDNAVGTANAIYDANKGSLSKTAIVATSHGYWDALSASTYAYTNKAPIFLTNDDGTLSPETLGLIKGGGFSQVYIVGGTAAVKESAETSLTGSGCNVSRIGGANAEDTSKLFAAMEIESGLGAGGTAVATSKDWYDALTGAADAARKGQVLVVASDSASGVGCVDATVGATKGKDVTVLGGSAAVPDGLYQRIADDVKARV